MHSACLSFFNATLLFSGMKVYVTDEKELIMEPCLKWAGNPNVTVAVKAFGLKATVQVTSLFSLSNEDFQLIERVCVGYRERERERT